MNEKKPGPEKGSGLEALPLISQLGMTIVIPIVLGALVGRWIDGKLGTEMIFFMIMLLLGIAAGFLGAYRLIMSIMKRK